MKPCLHLLKTLNIDPRVVAYYTGFIAINIVICFIPIVDLIELTQLAKLGKIGLELFEVVLKVVGKTGKIVAKTVEELFVLFDKLIQILQKGTEELINFIKKVFKAIEEWVVGATKGKNKGVLSTLGGKPIDKNVLRKIIKSFANKGGEIRIGGETQAYLDWRKAEGITYNEKLILLDENASTSAVYEELIHSAQYRTGKYNIWVKKYGNEVATYMMEKEAAEKLLKNAKVWKIPDEEIKLIEERLKTFIEELKKLNL